MQKITAKNAFGLHLIDYMSELLKKNEMDNFQVRYHHHVELKNTTTSQLYDVTCFQVASSTLDASTKIYAGRVDAVHSETYKVLTGLGRGVDKNAGGDGKNLTHRVRVLMLCM